MIKEIKKLRTYEQKLKSKLVIFEQQLSLLEHDEVNGKPTDVSRLKWLSKMISQIQDLCDKTNILLYNMIRFHKETYVK